MRVGDNDQIINYKWSLKKDPLFLSYLVKYIANI